MGPWCLVGLLIAGLSGLGKKQPVGFSMPLEIGLLERGPILARNNEKDTGISSPSAGSGQAGDQPP